jgi:NAD-dependent dihydropyrimidine dehydrogenase PreA subunit
MALMKTKRTVIKIDENLCNGCGNCVSGCHEGALQLIDGKAVMISDLYCDGLGACIGECPVGAISFEEREAAPYDEIAVMERLVPKGEAVVLAHLKHLKEHNEMEWVRQAAEYLKEHFVNGIDLAKIGLDCDGNLLETTPTKDIPYQEQAKPLACGCPGSMERSFKAPLQRFSMVASPQPLASQLTQWPVQLHLLNPQAGYFSGADVVLAADCTAYAFADFHNRFIRNHTLAIACPKLDSNKEMYIAKIKDMIDSKQINTLTVIIMEVPCCGGLVQIARMALEQAIRKVPVKVAVIGVEGDIKEEKWI